MNDGADDYDNVTYKNKEKSCFYENCVTVALLVSRSMGKVMSDGTWSLGCCRPHADRCQLSQRQLTWQ